MNHLLLNAATDFLSSYGLIILLVVVLIGVVYISYNRKKTDETKRQQLNSEIKPGVKVLTYHGVYGEVVSLTNTTDGIQVVIKTGDEKNYSFEKIHINAICSIDNSTIVVLDSEGNPITNETSVNEQLASAEPAKVEESTVVTDGEVKEAKLVTPKKKATSKKSTTTSTTTKKNTKSTPKKETTSK